MTALIKPTIAVLLGILGFQFFFSSWTTSGELQTILLGGISLLLMEKWKVHPAYVIAGALIFGAIQGFLVGAGN